MPRKMCKFIFLFHTIIHNDTSHLKCNYAYQVVFDIFGSVVQFLNIQLNEVFVTNYYAIINNFCNSLHVEGFEILRI